ncbi:MAG: sugar phosphate nucleotidyltransferase [bacterium]|nr:sugar phosphate nucleotidyltransferase [bacterium]
MRIKKAIVPIAGSGTRFLPLSKILPKEVWPLACKPVIQYIIEEIIESGINEVIFVIKPGQKIALDYFKGKVKTKNLSKSKYKDQFLEEFENLEKISKKISFSYVIQKKPLGDGHAILQAEKLVKREPCAVLFGDDIVDGKVPCLKQLIKVFEKYHRPVMALCKVPKSSFGFYGMVAAEPVGNRIYRIKKIIEKPSPKESPSNLAIVGKRIITPKVFDFLKNNPVSERGEIGLTEALGAMIETGEEIYGYEIKGKWLECGNKLAYLKSNLYLSLKHPRFGKELKNYLREEKL